jgi:hypothetical protein
MDRLPLSLAEPGVELRQPLLEHRLLVAPGFSRALRVRARQRRAETQQLFIPVPP